MSQAVARANGLTEGKIRSVAPFSQRSYLNPEVEFGGEQR